MRTNEEMAHGRNGRESCTKTHSRFLGGPEWERTGAGNRLGPGHRRGCLARSLADGSSTLHYFLWQWHWPDRYLCLGGGKNTGGPWYPLCVHDSAWSDDNKQFHRSAVL